MSERDRPALNRGRLLLWGFLLLLGALFFGRWGAVVYTDILWFASEGELGVYGSQLLWEWGTRLLIGGVAGAFAWVSLQAMTSAFRMLQIRRRFGDLVIQEQLPESYLNWGVRLSALLLGSWFALALPRGSGFLGMLLLMGEEWGSVDPIFQKDLGFFVFTLPALRGLVDLALILVSLLGLFALSGYLVAGRMTWKGRRLLIARNSAIHLGILGAALALFLGVRFHLAGFALLAGGSSGVQEIFGYADHRARLPAYQLFSLLALASGPLILWAASSGRHLVGASVLAGTILGGGLCTQIFPVAVQRFRVQPNELERETPYIAEAIRHTRIGFGLEEMTREEFEVDPDVSPPLQDVLVAMRRLPVWTESALLTSFRQLEAGFQYYDFQQVALDRYSVGAEEAQVAVAVREVDPDGIPDRGWQNLHLRERYIAGMGAVAADATRRTGEGRVPIFLSGIPPALRSGPGIPGAISLTRPSILVGSNPQSYAVIDPRQGEFLAPGGGAGVPGEDYPRGIAMGSFFRKLILAWRFQDANLLLASEVGSGSRLVIRRQAVERVRALAPFLLFPEAPYPVISEGRVVWILEGFTVSRYFPLSREHVIADEVEANYLRNSVKATVDAVTGESRLYIADPADPMIRAFRRGFPSLFHDLAEMPENLRSHLRYSRAYFEAQTGVLARYHQEDPRVFHGQQDLWDRASELSVGAQPLPYRPEYAFRTLPGEEEASYALSTLFVPQGRQILSSFLVARWTPEDGGELRLWDVAQEAQFEGPRQIDAMVEQDPRIAEQFSLWRQGGSQVWTGHLHLVPVGSRLFYLESVFLAADADAIPEIQRFMVSDGERVAMEPTLEGALAALFGTTPSEGPFDPDQLVSSTSREALDALDRAERSLRAGDWEGFGRHLDELREVLLREEAGRIP